jgi:hypothetical protein
LLQMMHDLGHRHSPNQISCLLIEKKTIVN